MLKAIICEDNFIQRKHIERLLNDYFMTMPNQMELALSAASPNEVINYTERFLIQSGFYLLDVDLQTDINGIELAAEIRKRDISATIVFITTKAEMVPLVFRLKVEAMDYIVKEQSEAEINQRIIECADLAYRNYVNGKRGSTRYFPIKTEGKIINLPYEDILFFETQPDRSLSHHIIIYLAKEAYSFRGKLKEIENSDKYFYSCHKSYVINLKKLVGINKKEKLATLVSGETIPISQRKVGELAKVWKEYLQDSSENN